MKKILILSTLMAVLSSANALAADANVTFNGTVSASTCTLAAADATKVLTIPNVSAATLYALGSPSGYTSYSVSSSFGFSACPAGLTKVISNYTYQGSLIPSTTTTAIPSGTATNVGLLVMQSIPASSTAIVNVNGTSSTLNQTTIVSNAASVPVTVGVQPVNTTTNTTALPTVGNYSGTYLVAFTYS